MSFSVSFEGFHALYAAVTLLMTLCTTVFSFEYLGHEPHRLRYWTFVALTLAATLGVFLSADLMTAYVCFEIVSLASYPMVAQEETDGALRAGQTYITISVIGGMVALMGMFLLYRLAGTFAFAELAQACAACENRRLLAVSACCLLFGFGAKAGMFPIHIWLPKAHPVAPAPASALLSGALTKSGVWGILAISCNLFRGDPVWGACILALGCVTMLLGAVLALFSIDLKRTLACSSMSQIGFILVGVGMMGLLGEENAPAARGTVLHMVNHSSFKLVLFLCAGAVFRNLHRLDLNEIRGFGRKKPLLTAAFLLGALGIGGIPLLNGYVSKTLLHESIVEGIPVYGGILKAVEWVFLFSGGLTLAYMTKLFVAVFVEKHPTRQAEFNAMRRYLSKPAAIALGLSALVIPVLGLSANQTMNAIADCSADFFHAGHLHHPVHYLSAENLKGAAISVAIGAAVYLGVVRTWMIRNGRYVNRWPKKLDLEDLVYRPVLLKLLPGLFGWIAALFGENRLTGRFAAGTLNGAGRIAKLFGENRITKPLAKGAAAAGEEFAAVFGENRVTGAAAKAACTAGSVGSHALSDSLDGAVLLLSRTVFRQSPEPVEDKVAETLSYRLGAGADRAAALLGKEKQGGRRYARLFYRLRQSFRSAWRQISGNLSFALLMLVLAICAVFVYILL